MEFLVEKWNNLMTPRFILHLVLLLDDNVSLDELQVLVGSEVVGLLSRSTRRGRGRIRREDGAVRDDTRESFVSYRARFGAEPGAVERTSRSCCSSLEYVVRSSTCPRVAEDDPCDASGPKTPDTVQVQVPGSFATSALAFVFKVEVGRSKGRTSTHASYSANSFASWSAEGTSGALGAEGVEYDLVAPAAAG